MLKIWGRKTSVNVQKAMWALSELGLPHERIDAGGAFGKLDTPEFAAMNPNRQIPVLDDNGFILWESSAIIRYLAATYGRGSLAPESAKDFARADQWMEWAQMNVYTDIITHCFLGLIRTPASERNVAGIAAAAKRAGEKLALLDAELAKHPYILGDTLTMADVPAGALLYRYYNIDIPRPKLANVEAWYQRLMERPAYAEHVAVDFSSMRVPGA